MNKQKYMQQAITLAKMGEGRTSPNPPVGAVIVKDDKVIGKGYHKKSGSLHAEIVALNSAGDNAKDADIYVTLEPCSTTGKTPPCIESIIKSGMKRVFIGSIDPNKANQDKSRDIFEKHKIFVEYGVLKDKTDELIFPFDTFVNKKRPYFILKSAMSIDGRIATCTGDSKWITNDESRKFVHNLRNSVDAILVGKNTLFIDNPSLNVRGIKNANSPYKIVLGSNDNVESDLNIFKDGKDKVLFIDDFNALCEILYEKNIMSVLIEGGAKVYKSFLDANLIDKFYFFLAPIIIGGDKVVIPIDYKGTEKIKDSLRLRNVKIKQIDDDVLIKGYPPDKGDGRRPGG